MPSKDPNCLTDWGRDDVSDYTSWIILSFLYVVVGFKINLSSFLILFLSLQYRCAQYNL